MSCPSFLEVTEEEQCLDLRSYLKALGADIPEENRPDGEFVGNIADIIDVCECAFEDESENDIETALNSIVNLLWLVPHERYEDLVQIFCMKICNAPHYILRSVALRVLRNLYEGLTDNAARYKVYYSLVEVSGRTDSISDVFKDLEELKKWFVKTNISGRKIQELLRLLHRQLLECKQSDLASKVMIELLSTYTEDNASQARDDAHRCIVASLADPDTFLLDHLLILKPVKFLEGELIHDLLTIFVSEKLNSYLDFYESNKDFVTLIGLSHDQNIKKMRYLTFMQVSENKAEVSFETIKKELQISDDEVESFIIDIVKTKMVRVKMNQAEQKVMIDSTMHRTFGKGQWQQLRDILSVWRDNVALVEDSMQHVVNAQLEQVKIN